ncbi:uncharacterized protein LOC129768877 isoform X2 [Toxorhynchites rutilus septentrionalis]|nr:uncharacterized protein LOC129768877 isoform X2 [Toxorhynchites rutilus septentrionalis]
MSTLVVLFVAISSGLVISFSIYSLGENFKQNCFLDANISFVESHYRSRSPILREPSNSSKESQILYKLQQNGPENVKYVIDEPDSRWGNSELCEYVIFTPLFHALFGVIWLAIFTMHGHGGGSLGSVIDRPWRIVFPSLIYFIVFGISAIICTICVSDGMNEFCDQFRKINVPGEISCARMITYFSLHQYNDLVSPDKNYFLVIVFPWIWMTTYICGALIMILRIILVTDFQLIRVAISIVEKDQKSKNDKGSTDEEDSTTIEHDE